MHIWSDLYFALLIPLLPTIEKEMGLSYAQVGLLRSVFNGSSGVLQIPAGFLAEGTGEFWPLVWGNMWVGLGLIGMALSPVLLILLLASFLGGLGGGAQHPLASSMVSRAYDKAGRSTAVGTVNFAGDLGKMASPLVALAVAVPFGWRAALWTVGISGTLFMALTMAARRSVDVDRPRAQAKGAADVGDERTQMGGFATLSGIGFLDAATRAGALVFIPFVMVTRGMSEAQISGMLVFLFAGGAAGKFICGWLGDRFGTVNVVWGTKGSTALLLFLSLSTPPLVMVPLMVALGVGLNGTSSVLYATVAAFVPQHRRARLYGFYYTTNEGGSILAPLLYGVVADRFGLKVAMTAMAAATACILPASLTLGRYLGRRELVSDRSET